MERRDGGREGEYCHTTTQIFHTHTHTLSLTIPGHWLHMSLQKEMGIVVSIHTQSKAHSWTGQGT